MVAWVEFTARAVCGLIAAERAVRLGISFLQAKEISMFHGTYDRAARADRYRKVAAEYAELSKAAPDQHLGSYYLRIAEDYQDQSQRELWALEREEITALATGADMPSPTQPTEPASSEIAPATAKV
jgi:hypothetical protein